MLIVADENIPLVEEAFAVLGDVQRVATENLSPATVAKADILVVRSVTRVGPELLAESSVKLVASATTGLDHIDRDWLAGHGIALVDGAGANANAVAEYVIAALLNLQLRDGRELTGRSLGIVGLGRIGRRIARYASLLGMRCVVHDPPLARCSAEPLYRPLEEILDCDVVSLHVPLERGGPDPTYHLVDDAFLEGIRSDSIVINTSRGAVVDNQALKHALVAGRIGGCVLDVWEGEPLPDRELVEACMLATPHIAGFSCEAKRGLTLRAANAACEHFGVAYSAPSDNSIPAVPIDLSIDEPAAIGRAVSRVFDIQAADAALRETLKMSDSDRAAAFQSMRSGAPSRREFGAYILRESSLKSETGGILAGLGFSVAPARTMTARCDGDSS